MNNNKNVNTENRTSDYPVNQLDTVVQGIGPGELDKVLEEIKRDPDTALSNINNMKIKLEMSKNSIEEEIEGIKRTLNKVTNPTILSLIKDIESATTEEDLNKTSNNLQALENSILGEIESMLRNDKELITTLSSGYGK